MTIWDALYLGAMPVYAPVIAYKRARHGKYRESLPAMLGRRLPAEPLPAVPRAWLHSVSVGETVAAGAVFRELRAQRPDWHYLSTTTTETGQAQAKKSLAEANAHTYAPMDFSWNVKRFLNAYRPTLYIVLETELWPNVLNGCARRGIPAFLVNGKLSARSAARYEKLRGLFAPVLESFTLMLMQTDEYAERMARIVGSDRRIRVTGNVKFDALPKPLSAEERAALRAAWGVADDAILIVAGSTHPTEEEIVLSAFRQLQREVPNARLMIAPRHPERFDAVAAMLAKEPEGVHRLSAGDAPRDGRSPLLLLDQMRVLARYFGGGEIGLVGGSWCNVGGHNLLEPAVHGIPVLYGPHMQNQPEIVRILDHGQATGTVHAAELGARFVHLAKSLEERTALGGRARTAAQANTGATARSVKAMLESGNR